MLASHNSPRTGRLAANRQDVHDAPSGTSILARRPTPPDLLIALGRLRPRNGDEVRRLFNRRHAARDDARRLVCGRRSKGGRIERTDAYSSAAESGGRRKELARLDLVAGATLTQTIRSAQRRLDHKSSIGTLYGAAGAFGERSHSRRINPRAIGNWLGEDYPCSWRARLAKSAARQCIGAGESLAIHQGV